MTMRRTAWATFVAATLAGANGCNFDDSATPAVPYYGPDAGGLTDATIEPDAPVSALCAGGATAVKSIADAIVNDVQGDCRIGGYFANLSTTDLTHFTDCFEVYMQAVFECPGITYSGSTDANGQACRDMVSAHQGLNATQSDFLAFMNDVIAELKNAKVTQADQEAVISALNGVQGVYSPAKTGNAHCTCSLDAGECVYVEAGADAGGDSGAADGGGGDSGVTNGDGGATDAGPADARGD